MNRTRVTDIRPVRTERVRATVEQLNQLAVNPYVRDIRPVRMYGSTRRVEAIVTRVEPVPTRRRRVVPFRVEGGRRFAWTVVAVLGVPAALFGTGWLVFAAWGSQIAAALSAAAVVAALVALGWLLSLTTGKCPGLHCPGCGHK